jgi:ribose transport system ATP-binding protein
MTVKLELKKLSKQFPGVKALDQISFSIQTGEIHGLVGENGAGKSTLIKLISGALEPTSGEMALDNRSYRPRSPREALNAGISTIYQERSWLPYRNVMFNIMLGNEPALSGARLDFQNLRSRCEEILRMLGARDIPLSSRAEDLKAGQKQILEIARALVQQSSLLIMDEATAALNNEEQEALFAVIKNLKASGLTILYISHRLEEIFRLADRVTVLRDGKLVRTAAISETTKDQLITDMVGRSLSGAFPQKSQPSARPLLEVKNLSAGKYFRQLSFTIHEGEVMGIAGLAGSGKEELGLALFGAFPLESGERIMAGKILPPSPEKAIEHGIAYLPDDRKKEGIFLTLSVKRNISLPVLKSLSNVLGHIRRRQEQALAGEWVERLAVKTPGLAELCENLSGGNQQKVSLAKWLASRAKVIILSHPTQEIDVGVKFEFYQLIAELSRSGKGIILISSELPELLGLCHNILVMRDGKMAARLEASKTDAETIMRYALGHEIDVKSSG